MDLKFIEDLLNARIAPATRTLTLTADQAKPLGDPIHALFAAYFNDQDFVLTGASVSRLTQPDRVLLTGTGGSFPFDTVPVRAYFTVSPADPANAALELVANPGNDWDLSVSFPVLGDSFFPTLSLSAPGFVLRSEDADAARKGLSFAASLSLSGNLSYLVALLSGTLVLDVAADITLAGDVPAFRLAPKKDVPTVGIGQFLPFEVKVVAVARTDSDGDLETLLLLEGEVTYRAAGGERRIRFGVDLNNVAFGIMHFVADLSEADLHLAQIVQLLSGSDVAPTLPPVFSALDNLTLSRWELYLDTNTLQPQAMSVNVMTRRPWALVPDLLTVDIRDLSLQVSRAETWVFRTDLAADFVLDQDGHPATVSLTARYPGFEMTGLLTEGSIDVKWLLTRYISAEAGSLVGTKLEVDQLYLYVAPSSGSFAFAIGIKTSWPIDIGIGSFTVERLRLAVSRLAQNNTGLFNGEFRLGTIEPPVRADITAKYETANGWSFEGGLMPKSELPLSDVLQSYFPSWDLSWTTINLKSFRVWFQPKPSYYRFAIDVLWTLNIGSFSPATIHGAADIAYHGTRTEDKYVGFVQGELNIANITLGVKVTYPDQKIALQLAGLTVDIETKPETFFLVKFPKKTLGQLIEMLVTAASGRTYTLPAPWDVLNLIDLSQFTLKIYPNRDPREIGLIYEPSPPFSFWFLELSKFELWYKRDPSTGKAVVELSITGGKFLGEPIEKPIGMDALDPASAPKVPSAGTQVFELNFLAMGQRVGLREPTEFVNVTDACDTLEGAFKKKTTPGSESPIGGTGLVASDRNGWLFAIHAKLLGAIAIRVVFVDPDLYGLAVSVEGDRFPKLKNLNFEIFYKRIDENTGVYQLELRVPDFMRQLEFGSVSITLPIIGIEIFTNGNFRLDFGFPRAGDFSRSFAVQVLPFTGAGGFYFGYLSGNTSKRVPQTKYGQFNPVIEAGIGLRIGFGKEINKGILQAGLSLTLQGIIEGTLAFYHPNDPKSPDDDALYYYLSAQVAVVGHIYGKVDFAIASAELDILARVGVALIMEACEPLRFTFFAEVTVSLRIRINLGLFKITISLSFGARITESFTLGHGSRKPWDSGVPHLLSGGRTRDLGDLVPLELPLTFHPVTRTDRLPVPLIFTPQFTPGSDVVDGVVQPAKARCIVAFSAKTTVGDESVATPSPFDEIARGAFLWTLAAGLFPKDETTPYEKVLDATIDVTTLNAILATLDKTSTAPPFDAKMVVGFLERYYTFTVTLASDDAKKEEHVAVFPMLSPVILRLPDGTDVPFDRHEMVGQTWFDAVRKYFGHLSMEFRNPEEQLARARRLAARTKDEREQSLSDWLMGDYFMLLAKGSVQAAIDTLSGDAIAVGEEDSLDSLAARAASPDITAERLARANWTRPLRAGVELFVPPFTHNLLRGERPADVAARFGVPALGVERHGVVRDESVDGNGGDENGVATGSSAAAAAAIRQVRVRGVVHLVSSAQEECLLGLARTYGVSPIDLALLNRDRAGLFASGRLRAPDADSMTVKDLLDRMQEGAKFEHLAGNASRFLLHGLRPPVPGAPEEDPTLQALYALTGQQFDASALVVDSEFNLHLADTLDWLVFDQPSASTVVPRDTKTLTVTISAKEETIIKALTGATLDPQITSLKAMDFYRRERKVFGLGHAIEWRPAEKPALAHRPLRAAAANGKFSLWAFPQNLQSLLQSDPTFRPVVEIIEQTNDGPHLPVYRVDHLLPGAEYSWGARIDLTVRRVYTDSRQPVPHTYELWGADPGAVGALQHLLSFSSQTSPIAALHLLYASTPVDNTEFNGLLSKPVESTSVFLIQTNLSTQANPDLSTASAAALKAGAPGGLIGQTAQDFVRFVWESSVVRSGGYYLYYRDTVDDAGLPEYLFNATDEVTISLLIAYASASAILQPYMNTLVVAKDIDIKETMFGLQAEDLWENVSALPPGAIGFEMTRTVPDPPPLVNVANATAGDAAPYIAEAYNLLNYQIAASGGFKESPFGAAVGPADDTGTYDPDPNASPRPRQTTGTWDYKAVVPVYRYGPLARVAPRVADDPPLPDPADNPYRGLGGTATLEFSWLDLFGNRIPVGSTPMHAADSGVPELDAAAPSRLDVPIRYVDPLIPVDRWPSVTTDFLILKPEGQPAPALQVFLSFNAGLYTTGTEDARRAAIADRATYQLIYFQLTQPGMSAAVTASLDDVASECLADLRDYATAIWRFLDAIVRHGTVVTPATLIVERPVTDTSATQIYQLTVSMGIARPAAHVADAHGDVDDPVRQVLSWIGAQYDETEPGAPLTLGRFTTQLEEAFPHLAVATAAPHAQRNDGNTARDIWLVRFGGADGIGYDVTLAPVFLAPLPLSRRLLSTRLLLHPYESGTPIQDTKTHPQAFSTVDLELQARGFLEAVDLFLSPQFVVPAWLAWQQSASARGAGAVADDPIQAVLDAKKALAEAIGHRIANVFQELAPTAQGLDVARRQLTQQLLIRLADLYTVDAIVQFPVEITAAFDDPSQIPNIFGTTLATAAKTAVALKASGAVSGEPPDYSFSTSEIALDARADRSFLTFLFGTRDPSLSSIVTLPLAFQRSHVQHDFVKVPGSEYESSQWLAFVTLASQEPTRWRALPSRGGQTDLGTVSIPVPLRAYPPAPALLSQDGFSPLLEHGAPPASVNPELDLAKRWTFELAYQYQSADQDTIGSTIHFNLPASSATPRLGDAADPDLLDALVQFTSVYPALLADLEKSLIAQPDPELAVTTMQSFAWLVGRVRTAWQQWPIEGRALQGVLPQIEVDVTMRQHPVTIEGVPYPVFAISLESSSSGREYHPLVALDGYKTQPHGAPPAASGAWTQTCVFTSGGTYLSMADGRKIGMRRVQVPELDLLLEQNGRAGLYIRRNEHLSDTYHTNTAFIYETPELRFGSVQVPVLRPAVAIDVARSTDPPPVSDKLYHYLLDFLLDFFTSSAASGPVAGPRSGWGASIVEDGILRINAGYRYALDDSDRAFTVTLPITLTDPLWISTTVPPEEGRIAAPALARALADYIDTWCGERDLKTRKADLRFELTLYSTQGVEQLPVLVLDDMSLNTELLWPSRSPVAAR